MIGPNGAGKSTLFKLITGQETPDSGTIDIGTDRAPRLCRPEPRPSRSVKKNVWEEISDGLDYMKVNGHDQSTRAYVGAFNFKGQDQQKNVGKLSGGERNRVNIAKMLKRGGNVLLLDEPTNDLDVETLGALEEAIENFAGCAVVISHDRFFLDRLAHAHPGVRGQQPCRMVRGQFRELRRRQAPPPGRCGGSSDGAGVQEADAVEQVGLTVRRPGCSPNGIERRIDAFGA